jgi:transposase
MVRLRLQQLGEWLLTKGGSVVDKDITYVGMDVHKDTIAVAYARGSGEVVGLGIFANKREVMEKVMRRLGPFDQLSCCYEAGPCGYVLYRQLTELKIRCWVVAPSKIPVKPGDRVKTDRRDARRLVSLLRSGDLEPVWVPGVEHEGLRDLTRAREAAKRDLQRHRNRVTKLLLRLGIDAPAGIKGWGKGYWRWIQALKLPTEAQSLVLGEELQLVRQAEELVKRWAVEIEQAMAKSSLRQTIAELQALRGVKVVSAATLMAELGDIRRFDSPRELMSYAGLVCTERSSGGSVHRGSLTKAGNSLVRFVVVEAAHHYRHLPKVSLELKKRQAGLSEESKRISWKAQCRLNQRFRRLGGRGVPYQKVVAALARELLGFIWAIARAVKDLPAPQAAVAA